MPSVDMFTLISTSIALVLLIGRLLAAPRVRKLFRVPFAEIEKTIEQAEQRGGTAGKPYDVFVSYKSQDAEIARQLAEQLLANGIRVWFAEYCITLHERNAFKQAIRRGLSHTRYGVCITTRRYFQSQWCRYEFDQLLKLENCGAKNVLNVRPSTEQLPKQYARKLAASPSFNGGGAPQKIGQWISEQLGVVLEPSSFHHNIPPARQQFSYSGQAFSLNLAGWKQSRFSRLWSGGSDLILPVYHYEQLYKKALLDFRLIVSDEVWSPRAWDSGADDLENYEELLDFARFFFAKFQPSDVVGVHLIFVDGRSHPCFTSRRTQVYRLPQVRSFKLRDERQVRVMSRFSFGLPGWFRLYSIQLPAPGTTVMKEFLFNFHCHGSFCEFCQLAPQMDALVHSFRWEHNGME